MPRVAKGTCRKIDGPPWYEWVETFVWEDDEFEGDIRPRKKSIAAVSERVVESEQKGQGVPVTLD